MNGSSKFLVGATAVVLIAVVASVFALGSPSAERALRLDDRRVTDVRGIADAVDLYWTRHAELPASLDALAAEPGVRIGTRDPATGQAYVYNPVDSASYTLCTTFDRASPDVGPGRQAELWRHGAGAHCYELEAEPIKRVERNSR